jgi:hypothetical protein
MKILIILFSLISLAAQAQATLGEDSVVVDLNDPPVPVEFIGIKATRVKEVITFCWSTATELNNDFFTIEESQDAKTWIEIGTVMGLGTVKTVQNYSWTYSQARTAYYRLSQTDYDGTTEQLALVVVTGYNASQIVYTDLQGRPTTAESPGIKIIKSEGHVWKEVTIK